MTYTSDAARINPDLKAKWVAALRSGDFSQGKEYLRAGNTYCCLGVLCKIYDVQETDDDDTGVYVYAYKGSDNAEALPHKLAADLGLDPIGEIFTAPVEDQTHPADWSLAELNDDGLTFSQIADLIDYFL